MDFLKTYLTNTYNRPDKKQTVIKSGNYIPRSLVALLALSYAFFVNTYISDNNMHSNVMDASNQDSLKIIIENNYEKYSLDNKIYNEIADSLGSEQKSVIIPNRPF